jgi:hypothetical protein
MLLMVFRLYIYINVKVDLVTCPPSFQLETQQSPVHYNFLFQDKKGRSKMLLISSLKHVPYMGFILRNFANHNRLVIISYCV